MYILRGHWYILYFSLDLANGVDPDEMPHYGFSLFAKVPVWEI